MRTFTYQQRVYFSDTDAQGIMYHANYLNFAEHARHELGREIGFASRAGGEGFVVKSIKVSYDRPAFLDDLLTVETVISEMGRLSMVFSQKIMRGEEVLATLEVKAAYVSLETKRPTRIPDWLAGAVG